MHANLAEVVRLRDQVAILQETVATLRAVVAPPIAFPPAWGLTGSQSRILAALYGRPNGAAVAALHVASAYGLALESGVEVVKVHICYMRRKLAPFGIEIERVHEYGYRLTGPSRALIRAALQSISTQGCNDACS